MAKKIEITEKQMFQFNIMLRALNQIGKEYQSPNKLRKDSEKDWGLDYEEAMEMSYENMQETAKTAIKGVKQIIKPE